MIYAFGHISGAHFNPAVSIAFGIGRHLPWSRVAAYASAQILGATVAAIALRATLGPDADLGVTQPAGSDLQSFAWEVVLTFFLMVVITAVATDIRAVGQAAALAIGGTVALGALVGGPISGASMNPARSIGPGHRLRRPRRTCGSTSRLRSSAHRSGRSRIDTSVAVVSSGARRRA